MTPTEASKEAFCHPGTILHHVRAGHLKKYPMGGNYTRRFWVDLDEVKEVVGKSHLEHKARNASSNLVTVQEAARRMGVVIQTIENHIKKGYTTKHYVLDSDKYYLVDILELERNATDGDGRRIDYLRNPDRAENLRRIAEGQPRVNGRFVKKG